MNRVSREEASGMRLVHGDHVCSVCESDCDRVTDLRREVHQLRDLVFVLAYELQNARELRDFSRGEIEHRFPQEKAA